MNEIFDFSKADELLLDVYGCRDATDMEAKEAVLGIRTLKGHS